MGAHVLPQLLLYAGTEVITVAEVGERESLLVRCGLRDRQASTAGVSRDDAESQTRQKRDM